MYFLFPHHCEALNRKGCDSNNWKSMSDREASTKLLAYLHTFQGLYEGLPNTTGRFAARFRKIWGKVRDQANVTQVCGADAPVRHVRNGALTSMAARTCARTHCRCTGDQAVQS